MNFDKYKKLLLQMIKFGMIGLVNASVDFSIYFTLTENFEFWRKSIAMKLWANFIAFLCANIISFILNKKFAFDDKNRQNNNIKYLKFFLVTTVSLLIYQLSLFLAVDYIKTYDIYGKIAGIMIGAVWNFSMYKIFIFKDIKNNK